MRVESCDGPAHEPQVIVLHHKKLKPSAKEWQRKANYIAARFGERRTARAISGVDRPLGARAFPVLLAPAATVEPVEQPKKPIGPAIR